MPENDQLQQNNLVQNEQPIQEAPQQSTENQTQPSKKHAWLKIIVLAFYEFFSYYLKHDDLEDYLELGVILLISILIIFT